MMFSRRNILAASAALPFAGSKAVAATAITISVDAGQTGTIIPPDYMGLGFEVSSVAVPGLLSAGNGAYVRLIRNLGRRGVIRIGGNTSDYARYEANGSPVSSPRGSVITYASLVELRGFLDALSGQGGWRLIWGLNLGANQLDNAVEEARAVASVMGANGKERLIAFEVGNEPDLFGRAGHRPADYNYDAWLKDFRRYKAAVRAAVPGAPFAGPDLAGAADWMPRFARDEGGDIALLSAHHYTTGQHLPNATQDFLLAEDRKYVGSLATFREAARAAGKPWRMVETNSFYGGGKEGVSDTFAATLWVLDYLFVLMNYGCAGINMETGVNHLGRVSSYSPIAGEKPGAHAAAPEYYGLLAFAQMGGGARVPVKISSNGMNLTAHAVKNGRGLALAVINKDAAQDADATIRVSGYRSGRLLRLTASALNAKTGVTLGGAGVAPDGSWTGARHEPVRVVGGGASLHVPAGSAALVWLT